jgi:hypothetical protein
LAEARGQPAIARDHLEAALKVFQAPKGHNTNELRVLAMRPAIDSMLGDAAGASQHADEAVNRAREATRGFDSSAWLGNALLAQGLALRAARSTARGDRRCGARHPASSSGTRRRRSEMRV